MANMKDKLREFRQVVNSLLVDSVGYADEVDRYDEWEKAYDAIRRVEKYQKAVRSHIRAQMRRTLKIKQAACQHTNRKAGATRFNFETKESVVLDEYCVDCKTEFDLRERIA